MKSKINLTTEVKINLTTEVKDIYTEGYKTSLSGIESYMGGSIIFKDKTQHCEDNSVQKGVYI